MPVDHITPQASRTVTVPCAHGIHLRVASRIVSQAHQFAAEVSLQHGTARADAKSILAMMKLGVVQGAPVTITAQGPDARAAVEAVAHLFETERVLCGAQGAGERAT